MNSYTQVLLDIEHDKLPQLHLMESEKTTTCQLRRETKYELKETELILEGAGLFTCYDHLCIVNMM